MSAGEGVLARTDFMPPKRILIFLLLGPLIGELALLGVAHVSRGSTAASFVELLKSVPGLFALYPIAVTVGLVPAFITGCVDELAAKHLPLAARVILCVVVGYLSTFLLTFALADEIPGLELLAVAGAIAGLGCCLIAGRTEPARQLGSSR